MLLDAEQGFKKAALVATGRTGRKADPWQILRRIVYLREPWARRELGESAPASIASLVHPRRFAHNPAMCPILSTRHPRQG
jgi:hypothetical protein